MGGVGPMFGQLYHFKNAAPEKIDYAIKRYSDEARRLMEVLNAHLEGKQWLAAGQFSAADIANYGWLRKAEALGYPIDGLDSLKQWVERIRSRDTVQRAEAAEPAWD
ncbi:glutathione S-transferase [Ramicandelaber brevisporus]|nr:glutathione S-transferase [Ramicandelaber brevisporus]